MGATTAQTLPGSLPGAFGTGLENPETRESAGKGVPKPPASVLRGIPLARAELFGKPCIGCRYTGGVHRYERDEGALCICGRPATQCHHAPPIGAGGGSASFTAVLDRGTFRLTPSIVAVCGNGNAGGCHARLHRGELALEWVWDSPEAQAAWWSGELLSSLDRPQHGDWLYGYGHWECHGVLGDLRNDGDGGGWKPLGRGLECRGRR